MYDASIRLRVIRNSSVLLSSLISPESSFSREIAAASGHSDYFNIDYSDQTDVASLVPVRLQHSVTEFSVPTEFLFPISRHPVPDYLHGSNRERLKSVSDVDGENKRVKTEVFSLLNWA